jgi:hypothetical protein
MSYEYPSPRDFVNFLKVILEMKLEEYYCCRKYATRVRKTASTMVVLDHRQKWVKRK